ncbi:MAG: leucine-rich repeat protein, partial [Eubacterium sp.]|nr:leucine-rich repeat protein [Eubacterium sp.]
SDKVTIKATYNDYCSELEIPVVPHTHIAEKANEVEPTCTEKGYKGEEICSICGIILTEGSEVAALGHDHKEDSSTAVTPTCTKTGKEADQVCTRCGDVIPGATLGTVAHTEEEIPAVAPKCGVAGSTAGKKCSVCGEILEAPEEVAALEHNYEIDSTTAVAPKCEKTGKEADQICSKCGDVIPGKTIEATGHTEETIPAVEATCEDTGWTEGKKCTVCKKITQYRSVVPALGHDYVDIENTAIEPTCKKTGKEADKKCNRCEKIEKGKVIEAKEFTVIIVPAVEATCEEPGSTAGAKCSVCDEYLEEPEVVPAKGHSWDDGIVTKEATTESAGIKLFTCSVCGKTREESIDKLKTDENISGNKEEKEKSITELKLKEESSKAKADGENAIKAVDEIETKYNSIDSSDKSFDSYKKAIALKKQNLEDAIVALNSVQETASDQEKQDAIDRVKLAVEDLNEAVLNAKNAKKISGVGTISPDGTILTDVSGEDFYVMSRVSGIQLKKNLTVADKKSGGKFKITKVTKKNGKVTGGNVTYLAPYNRNCTKMSTPKTVKIGGVRFKVTALNKNAFKGCTKLKSAIIEENVTSIGANAFKGCTNLKSINIRSNKLSKIGTNAFKGINKKATIKVPKKKKQKYKTMINKAKAPKSVIIK